MSIAAIVDAAITSDVTLLAKIPAARWIEADSLREHTPTAPFAEYRWGLRTPAFTSTGEGPWSQMLDIYVHDEPGSLDLNINPVLARVRPVLMSAVGSRHEGTDLVGVAWEYDGQATHDDGHRTTVRFARYRLAGKGI